MCENHFNKSVMLPTAVADMDKIVQQNAANAEESASASDEMNAQAEQMKTIVAELVALVGGNSKDAGRKRYANGTDQKLKTLETSMVPAKKKLYLKELSFAMLKL
jgi:hypothetical protein